MKKRLEIDNIESCLNRADEDEPLFVLRANDELAPDIVRDWAENYRVSKEAQSPEGMTAQQEMKHVEARSIADAMESWKEMQREGDKASEEVSRGQG